MVSTPGGAPEVGIADAARGRDRAVGRAVFLARWNRLRVEAALAKLHGVRVVEAAKVAAAEAELTVAAQRCPHWATWSGERVGAPSARGGMGPLPALLATGAPPARRHSRLSPGEEVPWLPSPRR
jgi:hypothetical protein